MGQSIDQRMNGSWDACLASPSDFAGANDIITNLARERESGIEIIERTPYSLIITSIMTKRPIVGFSIKSFEATIL